MRLRPESPYNLAVFRIAVCAILLVAGEWRQALSWCAFPAALRIPPEGLGWALGVVPITPALARIAQVAFVVAAPLGLVGLYARASLTVVTVSALYLFALPQLTGSVLHDMHLLWFAALLAASPCGDALSVDSWRARRRGSPLPSEPSVAYAWPLVCARVALGCVYLFPGFWKITSSGWAWIASDNLRNQMYWKWYENDWIPSIRIDGIPALCHLSAFAVVAFELSFLPLALFRRTRVLAAIGGFVFHTATQAIMRIGFFGLWGCYVILFDWAWLEEREPVGPARPLSRAWPLGAAIVAAVAIQGARGAVQAWPFACYPTFQWMVGTEIPDVVMTATLSDGRTVRLPAVPKSQAAWAVAWSVAGTSSHGPPSETAMRAYWERAARDPRVAKLVTDAREVQIARGWFSVLPGDRGQPPRREEPLGTITLRP